MRYNTTRFDPISNLLIFESKQYVQIFNDPYRIDWIYDQCHRTIFC